MYIRIKIGKWQWVIGRKRITAEQLTAMAHKDPATAHLSSDSVSWWGLANQINDFFGVRQ